MKTLTQSEFVALLASHKGAAFLGLDTLTDAKAKKTGNPYGVILKRARCVTQTGVGYEGAVNRQGGREGVEAEFVADRLPWGKWLVPNKVIEHNGRLYLRTQTTAGMRRKRPAVVRYLTPNGERLTREAVRPFLPEKTGSAKQESHGVMEEIQVRAIALDNVLRVRVNGETVILKGE